MREATEYQGWDAWFNKFKPVKNHLDKYASNEYPSYMFETYGAEQEYVKSVDPKYIWTYVDGDMSSLLVAGYHYINRIGYYVTEVPWEDDMDVCLLSVETECECYDENEPYTLIMNNGAHLPSEADPNCKKCKGNGFITEYVGE
jgi:hypothetical protein